MTASLNEKLRTVKWGKYKTSELFQPQKITNMLSKEDLSEKFNFPAYSSESTNNGIIGYTDSPEFICDDEHPVFVTFGDHTCSFNIATKSFSVLDNVKVLLPSIHNIRCLLWIITAWQKQIPNLGYARHWKIAKNCIVELPTKDGEIDFDFMESFVAELEAQRVAELSAYLTVSGYDNYELSAEELSALQRFTELDGDAGGKDKPVLFFHVVFSFLRYSDMRIAQENKKVNLICMAKWQFLQKNSAGRGESSARTGENLI